MAKDTINDDIEDEELEDEELDDELDEDSDEDDADDADDKDEDSDEEDKEKKPKMVKLSRHLKVVNRLKAQLAAKGDKPSGDEIKEIAEKHNVEPGFVEDVIKHLEGKLKPGIEKLETSQKLAQVKDAFGKEFDRLATERPELKDKKDLLWTLSNTNKYRKMTIDEIADEAFGQATGKTSSEDDKPGSKNGDLETTDFSKMTEAEIREKVLTDPIKAKKYYDWVDEQGED